MGRGWQPPGDIHTLVVPDGDGADVEMAALFHVTGAYVYVDEHGAPVAIEDVFSKLARTKEHYRRVGLEDEVVERLIR